MSKATAAFAAKKAEIDDLLARLAAASDDHFGADPEKLNWGHVGTLESVATQLAQVAEFLNV